MSQVTPAARLVRRDAEGEIALDRDLISIGRSADNNIVIPDQRVSRRHALIQRKVRCTGWRIWAGRTARWSTASA
jgi:hypothetical protein